jgi:hypothetical protein
MLVVVLRIFTDDDAFLYSLGRIEAITLSGEAMDRFVSLRALNEMYRVIFGRGSTRYH